MSPYGLEEAKENSKGKEGVFRSVKKSILEKGKDIKLKIWDKNKWKNIQNIHMREERG